MSWWGKVIGSTLGFVLVGPLGALLGGALGHSFDKGLKGLDTVNLGLGGADQERIQAAFFTATFSVMGRVAKSDGVVSATEIQVARQTMDKMQLNEEQKRAAINLFNQGKENDFDLQSVLEQFRQECGRRTDLLRIFMEIQLSTALADNELHPEEQKLLLSVAELLGFKRRHFEELLAMMTAQQRHSQFGGNHPSNKTDEQIIEQAYKILGMTSDCTDAELKKAYRRLISQHHPDKLVSKGLPEEMMKIATEKTREIKDAYEQIKHHRNK
ncbi:MAG: DnaJ like chaperone protein [Oleiphilaceae bacterium]|jgi:DnaJ like chaperone protein